MSGSACVSVSGGSGHDVEPASNSCLHRLRPVRPPDAWGAPPRAVLLAGASRETAHLAGGIGEVLQVSSGNEGLVREAVPRLPHGARGAGGERRRLPRAVAGAEARSLPELPPRPSRPRLLDDRMGGGARSLRPPEHRLAAQGGARQDALRRLPQALADRRSRDPANAGERAQANDVPRSFEAVRQLPLRRAPRGALPLE